MQKEFAPTPIDKHETKIKLIVMNTHRENTQNKNTAINRRRFRKINRSDIVPKERSRFGAALREERFAQDLTVADLASICGLTKDYIYKIERGDAAPPANERILQLGKAIGGNCDRLFAKANKISPDVEDSIFENPEIISSIIRKISPHGESGLRYIQKRIEDITEELKSHRIQEAQGLSWSQS